VSILDKAVVTDLHYYKPDISNRSCLIDMSVRETGETRPVIDRCTQYELSAKIGVLFWANQAQYNDALRSAQQLLLNRLHEDVLGEVAELQSALFSQDIEHALLIVGKIKRSFGL